MRTRILRKGWLAFATIAVALWLLPLVIGYEWVAFTDNVKSHNDLGRQLTSDALLNWNLGSLDERFGRGLWLDTVWDRVLPDTLGLVFFAGLLSVSATFASRRHFAATALCMAAFLLPFLLFTNLHIIHNYYQAANAVFLITAVGISLSCLILGPMRLLGLGVLLIVVAGQVAFFYLHFYPSMTIAGNESRLYRIAIEARSRTAPNQSLIVIGDDWSSIVPYYAERKSIAIPSWASGTVITKLIADPQSLLGDYPLGGIVVCQDHLGDYKEHASELAKFVSMRRVLASADGCMLFGEQR